jgi:hypothetical protein
VTSSSHACTSHTHDAHSDRTQRYGECFRSADCTRSNTISKDMLYFSSLTSCPSLTYTLEILQLASNFNPQSS